jgi:GNAT superfamily N-acetyltransferase
MEYKLTLTDIADDEVRKAILAPLVEYNTSQVGETQGRPISVLIHDSSNNIIGGLWGYTGFEWLFVQLLVVPASLRGHGIGTQVMDLAEAEAITRGCRASWLDTFEFQARGFYERRGYTCFGELKNYPPGYSRFFMKKEFKSGSGEV